MKCQTCQKELDLSSKLSFREECPHCAADIHSCLYCGFYDLSAYNECHESSADRVLDKDRNNYCEYFTLGSNEQGASVNAGDAKSALDDLFKK